MASELPHAGTVMGPYVVRALLGTGGMGLVYLAEHERLKRKVALKLLRPELAGDPLWTRRFFAEARAVNQIGHDNIVEITDFVDQGEHLYFVMELLKGRALNDVLKSGRLPIPRAVHIAGQVATALAAAHAAGVVHRDLKPHNVFLITRGRDRDFVKLLDFGIAKVRGITGVNDVNTDHGTVVGTPAYLAPEQLDDQFGDHRIDVYSFGIMLFEMTTGRRPFLARGMLELIREHLTATPPRPTTLIPDVEFPPVLEQLILQCIAKNPEQRPDSMQQVVAALATVARIVGPPALDDVDDEGSGYWSYPASSGEGFAVADGSVFSTESQAPAAPVAPATTPSSRPAVTDTAPSTVEIDPSTTAQLPTAPAPGRRAVAPVLAGAALAALAAGGIALVLWLPANKQVAPPASSAAAPLPSDAPAAPPPLPVVNAPAAAAPTPAGAPVRVTVDSIPDNAAVTVLGPEGERRLGVTPLEAELPEGTAVRVTVRRAGFASWTAEVLPRPGAAVRATLVKLKSPDAKPRPEREAKKPTLKEGAIRNPFGERR